MLDACPAAGVTGAGKTAKRQTQKMADMKELADRVKALEKQLGICVSCGMCQSVCPVFRQTRREADVARGKISLLTGLMENMFSDVRGVDERLNRCLLCGSCAANCPSGVSAVEIFIKARAIVAEYTAFSPVKKLIFKKMLANPGIFDTLALWAGKLQGVFIRNEANAQGTSCARLTASIFRDRHIVPLAATPYHRQIPEQGLFIPGKKTTIAFFTGCLLDKVFPGIAHAAVRVLTHHGAGVVIPGTQGCCGIPALAAGNLEAFNRLVDHNLALFEKETFDVLVTACATCTATIKNLWPVVYGNPSSGMKKRLLALSEKTMDINAFLVDYMVPGLSESSGNPQGESVTFHDPCHLKKSLGVASQPRSLIRASGCNLVEMSEADKCCGMGGSFNLYHYDLSTAVGRLKQQAIADTSCATVATGCPACIMQISDMLAKAKSDIRVCHPIELYAGTI